MMVPWVPVLLEHPREVVTREAEALGICNKPRTLDVGRSADEGKGNRLLCC